MAPGLQYVYVTVLFCLSPFVFETPHAFPSMTTGAAASTAPGRRNAISCAHGCHLSCRGSSSSDSTPSPNRFCYCRCRPRTIDYGTLVYTAVVDDIWQVRCGYLSHPFVGTALAMNDSGLLDEFAVTRCESDYTDECRGGDSSEVCSQWWAASLCMETCADFEHPNSDIVTTTSPSTIPTAPDELSGLCPPDKYFRSQRPSFGNPYSGCADFQQACSTLYDRGYCQLKPGTVNCQETCGRCIGDDTYMPWNPIRSQLIQWALNRRDDGTAKALMNYFMRQFADYMSEVHRACRVEAASFESTHRHNQQHQQEQHRQRQRQRDRSN